MLSHITDSANSNNHNNSIHFKCLRTVKSQLRTSNEETRNSDIEDVMNTAIEVNTGEQNTKN